MHNTQHTQPVLAVIGGGAAGFFCAVNAARLQPGLRVIIIEKTSKLLSKVKVSGGGRCNVTHACFSIPELSKKYPRGEKFLKKAFHAFNTSHCVQWFNERGVQLKTEADGRMFSITNSSQAIIDCLLREANMYGVEIMMNRDARTIAVENGTFKIGFADNVLHADYVLVACGGYPKSSMFQWLTALGHSIEEPVPSLFTFNMPGNNITGLMGVVVENARVKVVGTKLEDTGPLLVTHWGMSGPVILRLSAWGARELTNKNYHFSIVINWCPHYNEQSLRSEWQSIRNQHSTQKIVNRNPFQLPARMWAYLLQVSGINEEIRWSDLPGKEQSRLIKNIVSFECEVRGKTTFKEEFVTCGGIRLSEIDVNTMQSRLIPGLYFAGEIMDVDGITGGFNFQHAWTSGWIAANSIAAASSSLN